VSEPTSPLDPRDVALLRDARNAERPPPEVHARVRARLAASVAGSVSRDPGHGAGRGSAAAGSALSKAAIAVTALLVGGAGGATLYAKLRPPVPPQIVYIREPALVPAPPLAPPPPSATSIEQLPIPSAANAARPAGSASSSRTAQIGAERVLLDEARGAIVQGDPIRALDRIEQHRRTFATGILGEERDAMEVEALAKAGRSAEARAKADAFRHHTPNSLFLPAVESAIESIP